MQEPEEELIRALFSSKLKYQKDGQKSPLKNGSVPGVSNKRRFAEIYVAAKK
jgi:hypothetical protein